MVPSRSRCPCHATTHRTSPWKPAASRVYACRDTFYCKLCSVLESFIQSSVRIAELCFLSRWQAGVKSVVTTVSEPCIPACSSFELPETAYQTRPSGSVQQVVCCGRCPTVVVDVPSISQDRESRLLACPRPSVRQQQVLETTLLATCYAYTGPGPQSAPPVVGRCGLSEGHSRL